MLRGVAVIFGCLSLLGCSQPTQPPSGKPDQTPPQTQSAPTHAEQAPQGVLNRAVIDARKTPALERCLSTGEAAQGATFPMFDCLSDEIALQDRALNTAYQAVLTASRRSDAEVRQNSPGDAYGSGWTARIVEAQKAWVAYRDGKCLTENYPDGQLYRFSGYPSCILDETIKRTIELEQLADFIQNY